MVNSIFYRPNVVPADTLSEAQFALLVANLRQAPDWETLMEIGITPELLVGSERRCSPRNAP